MWGEVQPSGAAALEIVEATSILAPAVSAGAFLRDPAVIDDTTARLPVVEMGTVIVGLAGTIVRAVAGDLAVSARYAGDVAAVARYAGDIEAEAIAATEMEVLPIC